MGHDISFRLRPLCSTGLAVLLLAGCGTAAAPASPTAGQDPTAQPRLGQSLLDRLTQGGYVLFFRHTERDAGAMPTAEVAAADNAGECRPGTELTPQGLEDARAVGASFVRHGIKVDQVYASPACRAAQMANAAFGRHETKRALAWLGMWADGEGPVLAIDLRRLLGTRPSPGRTTVLISHNDVLKADRVGRDVTLEQGEAAVFVPLGGDAFTLIGRITLEEWRR